MLFNTTQPEELEILEINIKKLLTDDANKQLSDIAIIEKAVREELKLKKNSKVVITKLKKIGTYKAALTSKSYKIIITL